MRTRPADYFLVGTFDGKLTSFANTCECILCHAEIGEPFFEFFTVNLGALVEPCILNGGSGWNCEQLGNPKVLGSKAARFAVAQRE